MKTLLLLTTFVLLALFDGFARAQSEIRIIEVNYKTAATRVKDSSERGRALSLLVKARALAEARAPLPSVNRAFQDAFEALKPFGRRQLARAHELHFEALTKRERFKEAAGSAQRALELMHPALSDT